MQLPTESLRHELTGQTVVVLGGSAGIGLETARHAAACGADVLLVGRDPDRLRRAANEVRARGTSACDVTDLAIARYGAARMRPLGTFVFVSGTAGRRVVGPADIAALAIHLMTNTAVTGATFDIDGGQQLLPE